DLSLASWSVQDQIAQNVFYYPYLRLTLLTPPIFTLFPYTTLFRSRRPWAARRSAKTRPSTIASYPRASWHPLADTRRLYSAAFRSEEHTSELQSRGHLVCRLLLEKKKKASCKRTTRESSVPPSCHT